MDADNIAALIRSAFPADDAPEFFTRHEHCEDCAEAHNLLSVVDEKCPSIEDAESEFWRPLALATTDAWKYFVPVMADYLLTAKDTGQLQLFMVSLRIERMAQLTAGQRLSLVQLLRHARAALRHEIREAELYQQVKNHIELLSNWSDSYSELI